MLQIVLMLSIQASPLRVCARAITWKMPAGGTAGIAERVPQENRPRERGRLGASQFGEFQMMTFLVLSSPGAGATLP